MKTTRVQCSVCGRFIESTTVTAKSYTEGEVIDYGCPYDGAKVPLKATSTKKARKRKVLDEDMFLGALGEENIDEPKPT